jgi:SAM-dependent methyltransferase
MLRKAFGSAFELNSKNVLGLARTAVQGIPHPQVCDLGCGDGVLTRRVITALPGSACHVVEIYPPNVATARGNGFCVTESDLNGPLALPSSTFDLVLSNQVIEHLYDTDLFLQESNRILKPGGTIITSTENAASWHNIAALVLGWQPFSLTNISDRRSGIGNPLALHRGEAGTVFPMQHHRLLTLRGLKHLLREHGFYHLAARVAGYYPLPAKYGRLDPRHAHFITVAGRKK